MTNEMMSWDNTVQVDYIPTLFSFLTALNLKLMTPIVYTKWKKVTKKKPFIILLQASTKWV